MKFRRELELEGVTQRQLFDWHARPGAFERLVPPWQDIRVVSTDGHIRDGAVLTMQIRNGPIPVTWEAHHEGYVEGEQFRDVQARGPFRAWAHTHRFEETESGSRLVDDIDFRLPLAPVSEWFGGWLAKREIDRMFEFRHRRTENDLMRHARYADAKPLTVAITGASGLIGTALSAFLTTGGHTVIPVTRRRSEDGIYWKPSDGEIDAARFEGVDAVVHLAGESIAGGRWSDEKKRRIMDSRVEGTTLLAKALANLDDPPRVLVSASAIGYYGDRDEPVDETSEPGEGFLADVCKAWEEAADPARDAGIRVVHPRIGIVLSPQGGALAEMLTPFKLGAGGVVGSGDQGMPWIALDDVVAAIHFALMEDAVEGPVNLTAPNPVDNREFTKVLGKVLGRPTIVPVPKFGIKMLFGEMGEKLLLEGAIVMPKVLADHGFEWDFPNLEGALRHLLGK
jgi:uncharacterized protein (TIGR01777 family)